MSAETLLELRHISKQYPGVLALNDVSVSFNRHEVHALVGENGAGKSTLIKVLSGAVEPDKGEIIFDGTSYRQMTPHLSQRLGIAVIYQEFNLVPALSVAENVFVGNMPGGKVWVDKKSAVKKTAEIFERMRIDIEPGKPVREFSVAYKQMVEIAKALSKNVRLMVMDEPTAPLTNKETETLFGIVENLKAQGITVIFISHRLDEVFHLADRITILRDGSAVGESGARDITKDNLIHAMVGRQITDTYPARTNAIGEPMLEARNINGPGVRGVSFSVHSGEILGLGGLVGAGRTETVRFLFGADKRHSGSVVLKGKNIQIRNPGEAVSAGIGFIPEDRKQQGIILNFPIRWNVSLTILRQLSTRLFLDSVREKQVVEDMRASLSIKTPDIMQLTRNLSGGNQQKVALAKWLAASCDVLVFDEPTRGIDVGTRYEIYKLMNDLCAKGKAIIMVSSDMEELLGMSDRIVVLCEGRKTGELQRCDFSQEKVLRLASEEGAQ
jgi:ribose transport system ATP-binding protein